MCGQSLRDFDVFCTASAVGIRKLNLTEAYSAVYAGCRGIIDATDEHFNPSTSRQVESCALVMVSVCLCLVDDELRSEHSFLRTKTRNERVCAVK